MQLYVVSKLEGVKGKFIYTKDKINYSEKWICLVELFEIIHQKIQTVPEDRPPNQYDSVFDWLTY